MVSRQEYFLMEKSNWMYTFSVRLYRRVEYNPRVLKKKTKKNIENLQKHPYFFKPYKPAKRFNMKDMQEIYDRHRTLKEFVEYWLEPRMSGLPDGWYALVGKQYKTRFVKAIGEGGRDFRWAFKFQMNGGHVTEIQVRSKGGRSVRRWNYPSRKNRPKTYFGIVKYYALRKRLG